MVQAEHDAAGQALADVTLTTPGTAGLLARIAAARAVHADLLAAAARLPLPVEPAPTPPPASPTPGKSSASGAGTGTVQPTTVSPTIPTTAALDPAASTALSRLLSAEHAAVFAYGLITARASGPRQDVSRALWRAHQARRDQLETRLVAAGVTPPAARPAYDAGRPPTTRTELAALATRVEDGMAAVALFAVTTASGQVRADAALDLVRAARRSAGWRGTPQALPG